MADQALSISDATVKVLRESVVRCGRCQAVFSVFDFEYCPLCDSPDITTPETVDDDMFHEALLAGALFHLNRYKSRKALHDALFPERPVKEGE